MGMANKLACRCSCKKEKSVGFMVLLLDGHLTEAICGTSKICAKDGELGMNLPRLHNHKYKDALSIIPIESFRISLNSLSET